MCNSSELFSVARPKFGKQDFPIPRALAGKLKGYITEAVMVIFSLVRAKHLHTNHSQHMSLRYSRNTLSSRTKKDSTCNRAWSYDATKV